jgi:tetratricopeptide (TPR) repeat protein
MKPVTLFLVVVLATGISLAQTYDASKGQAAPAAQQPGAAAPPAGKRPPQAKTQPEFDAYNAAAKTADAAAFEKGAEDFATKFPDSELRILLYKTAMRNYQNTNALDKMGEMGRKVLTLDADDPEALVDVAQVLAERTRDTDLDKDQKQEEATKLAQRALETVETDLSVPAGTPQDRIDAYKGLLRSSAYSVLGALTYNRNDLTRAADYLQKSIDAFPQQPDPVTVLRLGITQDKQGKYTDALVTVEKAVQLTQENTPAGNAARRERDRLKQLTGGPSIAPATPPKN